MTSKTTHWTGRSADDFLYSIASDFIEDLKDRMRTLGMTQSKLANAANVNKSYVSRVFKDPGNLTLETVVKFARTVGMTVAIVAHEDTDPDRGPIDPGVFRRCWEETGKPRDMWAFEIKTAPLSVLNLTQMGEWGGLPFGMNRGLGNRPLDIRKSAITVGVKSNIPEYTVRETKQTPDPEVFTNA